MRCARCGSLDDKVVDSRLARDGASIRRRRECLKCGHRYTTYETIEQGKPSTPFMVDGDVVRIEMFDRDGRNVFGTIENRVAARKG